MIIQHILDADDPRISVYRNLKDKDLQRSGAFIIEGKFILETLLTRSNYKISSIFIAADRLSPLHDILAKVPLNVPVYVAAPDVMADIAGFNVHRGILAVGEIEKSAINLPALLSGKNRVAILSNIANPDNIGAIFRNAAGLGVEAILLDEQCCSPLYRKAIRVSMGASLVLPWMQARSISGIISQLQAADFTTYALSLQGVLALEDVLFQGRSAFVFGEEAHGLPEAVQALCKPITIAMSAGTDSLNVAAASAIVFHAARMRKN
jgi:tRNA G18 (ribose-2'-O)-methylase SpoU